MYINTIRILKLFGGNEKCPKIGNKGAAKNEIFALMRENRGCKIGTQKAIEKRPGQKGKVYHFNFNNRKDKLWTI